MRNERVVIVMGDLGAVIFANANGTLAIQAIGPESSKLNIALAHVGMNDKKPGTEDTLGKNIEHSVCEDLTINANLARSISKTPDTVTRLVPIWSGADQKTYMG